MKAAPPLWLLRTAQALVDARFRVVLFDAPAHGASDGKPGLTSAVLPRPPRFSHAFAEHLRIPLRTHKVMRRNLENRLEIRWEELHVPTLARGMTAPALVIHDRDDQDVPFSHGEEIAAAWPGALFMATSGLGHRALVRDPEVIQRIITFLKDGLSR